MKDDTNTQWRAPYRAAYWRAANRADGGILLTLREHSAKAPGVLASIARKTAESVGITLGGGFLVVLDADGAQQWMTTP